AGAVLEARVGRVAGVADRAEARRDVTRRIGISGYRSERSRAREIGRTVVAELADVHERRVERLEVDGARTGEVDGVVVAVRRVVQVLAVADAGAPVGHVVVAPVGRVCVTLLLRGATALDVRPHVRIRLLR